MATTSAELINAYDVPLRRMLTYRLARLNAQLNAQAARILRESSGLSQTQWRVLVMIDSLGPLSPNHIVRHLLMDKGQLSRTIKSMEALGLIRVEESESDHRSHRLSLKQKGRDLFKRALPAMRARQQHLTGCLERSELDTLLVAVEKLEQGAKRLEQRE
jgi:DNA-binding MarR family transcriptional regulator